MQIFRGTLALVIEALTIKRETSPLKNDIINLTDRPYKIPIGPQKVKKR